MAAMTPHEEARGAADRRMVALADLLRRAGAELARAAERLAALEDALEDVCERRPGAAARRRLQDLDALRQEAAALGDFLTRLAAQATPLALDAGPALRATPLATLAARLGGAPVGPDAAGEVELF